MQELQKIQLVQYALSSSLEKILRAFPYEEGLPVFYRKLLKLTLDAAQFRKSLAAVNWARNAVNKLSAESKTRMQKEQRAAEKKKRLLEFYGRVSSIMKQISPQLQFLEKARLIFRQYPDIKEMFTVCIYGFPNVGKTTLLNALTGSRAKVAEYAFTTTGINAGYIGKDIQVLDVPGTLARKEKMNVIELQAELVLEELADVIIYVFDLSGYSGFPAERQRELYQKVQEEAGRRGKKALVYVAKKDLTEKAALKAFDVPYYTLEELRGKIRA